MWTMITSVSTGMCWFLAVAAMALSATSAEETPKTEKNAATKRKVTVDTREAPAVVTWENSGPDLIFRLCTGEADYTFIASPEVIRQIRQMLSWADGH